MIKPLYVYLLATVTIIPSNLVAHALFGEGLFTSALNFLVNGLVYFSVGRLNNAYVAAKEYEKLLLDEANS